jgi:hypothetical protein
MTIATKQTSCPISSTESKRLASITAIVSS